MRLLDLIARDLTGFVTPSGSGMAPIYTPRIMENGVIVLKQTGEENRYARIQADRDSCNIEMLVQRFTSGDVGALSRVQGFYGDVLNAPKSYAQLLQTVNDAHEFFDAMSADKKAKFNNSFEQFFSKTGSAEWFENLGLVKSQVVTDPPAENPVDKEVKE